MPVGRHVPFDRNKHPRGKGGRFIDVPGRMRALGGVWNDKKRTWTVPREQREGLAELLADLGLSNTVEPRRTGGGTKRFVTGLVGPGETQEVNVADKMRAIDGVWNPQKETWTVPRERAPELKALLADLGFEGVQLKPTSSGTKRYVRGVPGPGDTGTGKPDKPTITPPTKPTKPDKPKVTKPDKPTPPPAPDPSDPTPEQVEAAAREYAQWEVFNADKWQDQSSFVFGFLQKAIQAKDGGGDPVEATARAVAHRQEFNETQWPKYEGIARRMVDAAGIARDTPDRPTVTPPPPAVRTPEQESLDRISEMAAAMRSTGAGRETFTPTVGATVHLAGIPARVVAIEPSGRQVRRDPVSGEDFLLVHATVGGWKLAHAVETPSGAWTRSDLADDRTVDSAALRDWQVVGGDVGLVSLEYPNVPDAQPFNQPVSQLDETTSATLKPWKDEVQVRAIGQAIREHMDKFGDPNAAELARLRADRKELMYTPGGGGTPRFKELDARIRAIVADTPEGKREALIQQRVELNQQKRAAIDAFNEDSRLATTMAEREAAVKKYRKTTKALASKVDEITGQIAALHDDTVVNAERLREILRGIRPGFGSVGSFKPDDKRNSEAWKATEVTARSLPGEWVQASKEAGEMKIELSHRRGQYAHSFWGPAKLRTPPGERHTMTHELGHRVQYTAHKGSTRGDAESRVDAAVKGFHARRTREAGTTTQKLQKLRPGHGYSASEVANEDKYFEAYVGREYGGDPREIWTMGLESVWHGKRARYGNLQLKEQDPEFWDLIVGMIAGVP